MSVPEILKDYGDGYLEALIREHLQWEKDGSLSEDAFIRGLAHKAYGDDAILMCDRVMFEVYRTYSLRRMAE